MEENAKFDKRSLRYMIGRTFDFGERHSMIILFLKKMAENDMF